METESTVCASPLRLTARSAKEVYLDLFDGRVGGAQRDRAARYLRKQLASAACLSSDFPDDLSELMGWMEGKGKAVGLQHLRYLEERRSGAPRRFFRTKSHALYFLKCVAPTKMVDGAWLYGLLEHWQDTRLSPLIKTYLEELGEGSPAQNHVAIYRRLLAAQGVERWDDLSDSHYVQGALQLALAYNARLFLPEIIGYNLGYEQLPLHLFITAHELKELGIDPYYFTLHITVDNADSGHARKAVESLVAARPHLGDSEQWLQRVRNGYNLNFAGADTQAVIESFDLDGELVRMFSRKGIIGQYAHSDRCRVANRTLNDWLSRPGDMPMLLSAMEDEGWFKHGQDPQQSRFWKLLRSDKARMAGVFSAYEEQLVHDWIAGSTEAQAGTGKSVVRAGSLLPPESKRHLQHMLASGEAVLNSDFDAELCAFEHELAEDPKQTMDRVIALMSPALHHTPPGLAATRLFHEAVG